MDKFRDGRRREVYEHCTYRIVEDAYLLPCTLFLEDLRNRNPHICQIGRTVDITDDSTNIFHLANRVMGNRVDKRHFCEIDPTLFIHLFKYAVREIRRDNYRMVAEC